jgi:hypothetical protein
MKCAVGEVTDARGAGKPGVFMALMTIIFSRGGY